MPSRVDRSDMNALRALFALVTVLAVSACAAPLQNGGVEVRPGVEARLDTMCRFAGGSAQKVCEAPEEGAE